MWLVGINNFFLLCWKVTDLDLLHSQVVQEIAPGVRPTADRGGYSTPEAKKHGLRDMNLLDDAPARI